MANVTDYANNAAAVAGGYVRIQKDYGAGKKDRFVTEYFKPQVGGGIPGQADGVSIRAVGVDDAAQATADTNALNALNAQRKHYFGGSAGRLTGAGCPQSPGSRGEVFATLD